MINIVCALHCEAKPIIDEFKLSLVSDSVFPIFENGAKNQKVSLVVSGLGRVSTAAAMAYLFAKNKEQKNVAWVNYGIAGHKNAELGSWINVNKITESSSGTNWYPSRFPKFDCLSSALITVDEPVSKYDSLALYDMEASAFMSLALKFSSVELIQVIKIVSDNEEHHLEKIDKQYVQNLLKDNMSPLIELIGILQDKHAEHERIYGDTEVFKSCLDKWHFTQYQKKELERLIQRWNVLCETQDENLLKECKDAKQVISVLKHYLDNVTVVF